MKRILFLCTANSCRSQMAEGILRKYWGEFFEVYSAGTKKRIIDQYTFQVMKEIDIDLSNHFSKTINELPQIQFHCVITVCDTARDECPYLYSENLIHRGFSDPPRLAQGMQNEEDILNVYRTVRDEIVLALTDLQERLL